MGATVGTGADKQRAPLPECGTRWGSSSPSSLAQVPPGKTGHRLRKKRIKRKPDFSPNPQNLDLGGPFRALKR